MRKKRAITLLEIMIVILLIGLIGGVISYNLKGSLDKGKKFRTEQGARKLEDILNLEIQSGAATVADLLSDKSKVENCLKDSGLIPAGEVKNFLKDGWGKEYIIDQSEGQIVVKSENAAK